MIYQIQYAAASVLLVFVAEFHDRRILLEPGSQLSKQSGERRKSLNIISTQHFSMMWFKTSDVLNMKIRQHKQISSWALGLVSNNVAWGAIVACKSE